MMLLRRGAAARAPPSQRPAAAAVRISALSQGRSIGSCAGSAASSLTAPRQGRLGGSSSSTRTMATTTQAPAGGATIAASPAWQALKEHVKAIEKTHLRELLADGARCDALVAEEGGLFMDFSRQRMTQETLQLLLKLAEAAGLPAKIQAMFAGEHINATEDRAVLHVATRARREQSIKEGGKDVVPEVWEVLDKIRAFSDKVRKGEWLGVTGKPLKNVVAVGIGGSFLGPLFVHNALETEPVSASASAGRTLRFLANVDPIDATAALKGLDPEETLVVIISKTFTTAETMLNARTCRAWLTAQLGEGAVAKHMVAVSTNLKLVKEFGIDPDNAFGFWDWVGGRFSVCSAVGMLPLTLQYGWDITSQFLAGANSMDDHFKAAPLSSNLPVLLGLISLWNISFLGYPARALLPYCQALAKFAPHIQQVSMESNGKGVDMDGRPLSFETGEIDFGEPGTNGQHSFYQLIHQGRVIPCDFIGIARSQQPVHLRGEVVSNHDELMSNFFAQPDALAYGKTEEELRAAGVPEALVAHKVFTGNRPSLSLLLPELTPYTIGQLLSLYEHQVAVQGWVWGINSFDQWGVELGKVLAVKVRSKISDARGASRTIEANDGFNRSTTRLLNRFLGAEAPDAPDATRDVFPADLLKVAKAR